MEHGQHGIGWDDLPPKIQEDIENAVTPDPRSVHLSMTLPNNELPNRTEPKLSQRSPSSTTHISRQPSYHKHTQPRPCPSAKNTPCALQSANKPNHHPTPTRRPCRPSAAPKPSTCRPSYSRSSSLRLVELPIQPPAVSSRSPLSTMTTTSSGGNRHFQVRHRCMSCCPLGP